MWRILALLSLVLLSSAQQDAYGYSNDGTVDFSLQNGVSSTGFDNSAFASSIPYQQGGYGNTGFSSTNNPFGDTTGGQTGMRLEDSIPGIPAVDYPIFPFVPPTSFTCDGKLPGYYADTETGCQAFHICYDDRMASFLCPNGTTFHQQYFVCDWWFNSDCSQAPNFYSVNANLFVTGQQLHTTDYGSGLPVPVTAGYPTTTNNAQQANNQYGYGSTQSDNQQFSYGQTTQQTGVTQQIQFNGYQQQQSQTFSGNNYQQNAAQVLSQQANNYNSVGQKPNAVNNKKQPKQQQKNRVANTNVSPNGNIQSPPVTPQPYFINVNSQQPNQQPIVTQGNQVTQAVNQINQYQNTFFNNQQATNQQSFNQQQQQRNGVAATTNTFSNNQGQTNNFNGNQNAGQTFFNNQGQTNSNPVNQPPNFNNLPSISNPPQQYATQLVNNQGQANNLNGNQNNQNAGQTFFNNQGQTNNVNPVNQPPNFNNLPSISNPPQQYTTQSVNNQGQTNNFGQNNRYKKTTESSIKTSQNTLALQSRKAVTETPSAAFENFINNGFEVVKDGVDYDDEVVTDEQLFTDEQVFEVGTEPVTEPEVTDKQLEEVPQLRQKENDIDDGLTEQPDEIELLKEVQSGTAAPALTAGSPEVAIVTPTTETAKAKPIRLQKNSALNAKQKNSTQTATNTTQVSPVTTEKTIDFKPSKQVFYSPLVSLPQTTATARQASPNVQQVAQQQNNVQVPDNQPPNFSTLPSISLPPQQYGAQPVNQPPNFNKLPSISNPPQQYATQPVNQPPNFNQLSSVSNQPQQYGAQPVNQPPNFNNLPSISNPLQQYATQPVNQPPNFNQLPSVSNQPQQYGAQPVNQPPNFNNLPSISNQPQQYATQPVNQPPNFNNLPSISNQPQQYATQPVNQPPNFNNLPSIPNSPQQYGVQPQVAAQQQQTRQPSAPYQVKPFQAQQLKPTTVTVPSKPLVPKQQYGQQQKPSAHYGLQPAAVGVAQQQIIKPAGKPVTPTKPSNYARSQQQPMIFKSAQPKTGQQLLQKQVVQPVKQQQIVQNQVVRQQVAVQQQPYASPKQQQNVATTQYVQNTGTTVPQTTQYYRGSNNLYGQRQQSTINNQQSSPLVTGGRSLFRRTLQSIQTQQDEQPLPEINNEDDSYSEQSQTIEESQSTSDPETSIVDDGVIHEDSPLDSSISIQTQVLPASTFQRYWHGYQ